METQFERLLREKLQIMLDMRIENLTVSGVSTFEDYKFNLGYIEALRHILAACDEINEQMGIQ